MSRRLTGSNFDGSRPVDLLRQDSRLAVMGNHNNREVDSAAQNDALASILSHMEQQTQQMELELQERLAQANNGENIRGAAQSKVEPSSTISGLHGNEPSSSYPSRDRWLPRSSDQVVIPSIRIPSNVEATRADSLPGYETLLREAKQSAIDSDHLLGLYPHQN